MCECTYFIVDFLSLNKGIKYKIKLLPQYHFYSNTEYASKIENTIEIAIQNSIKKTTE